MGDSPLIDMTEMVRVKERELHEIHELRCHQLENMIDERDKLIADASKRFSLLKDDFQYNLTLLEARDAEISRLNSVESTLRSEIEEIDSEKIGLSNRLNDILKKDMDRAKKHRHDKDKTKQILSELQQELEALRWSTTDEIGCKNREIESLKKEVRRAQQERDDALESQRSELMQTYDKLLQAREKEFSNQESSIADQVHSLEQRFHGITTENTRLKSELGVAHREHEKMAVALSAADERCMAAEWRLADAEKDRREAEEELHRKLQTTQADLTKVQQDLELMTNESRREFEKLRAEQKREREYSALQLRHATEAQEKAAEDADMLRTQLAESEHRESLCKREVEMYREQAGKAEVREAQMAEKLSTLQDASKDTQDRLASEVSQLRQEIDKVQTEHSRVCSQLSACESTLQEVKDSSAQKLIHARDQLLEVTRQYEMQKHTEVANARMEAEAEFIASNIASQSEGAAAAHSELESLRRELGTASAALEDLRVKFDAKTKECDEERMEAEALRLRLRLHGANADGVNGSKPGAQFAENRTLLDLQNHHRQGGTVAPSPMFSEDMGPVSIPASPSSSPVKHAMNRYPSGGAQLQASDEFNYKFGGDSPNVSGGGKHAGGVAMLEPLDLENKRLKAAIRDMRKDAEDLHLEMESVAEERDVAERKAEEMESRLQSATSEVNRLRQERRRLMDVSNELRAVIHQLRSTQAPPPEDDPSPELPPPRPQRDDDDVDSLENGSLRSTGEERENLIRNQQAPPPAASNYSSGVGSKAKRATERETASQQAALQRLKNKQFGRNSSVGSTAGRPRNKVVNYAKSDNFAG